MKNARTSKQYDLFRKLPINVVTLPKPVQFELIRALCELILELRESSVHNPGNRAEASGDE